MYDLTENQSKPQSTVYSAKEDEEDISAAIMEGFKSEKSDDIKDQKSKSLEPQYEIIKPPLQTAKY